MPVIHDDHFEEGAERPVSAEPDQQVLTTPTLEFHQQDYRPTGYDQERSCGGWYSLIATGRLQC